MILYFCKIGTFVRINYITLVRYLFFPYTYVSVYKAKTNKQKLFFGINNRKHFSVDYRGNNQRKFKL